ncbi:hypothetical protein KY290_009202 [Solanum tuberosum]|uniref:DUF4283 domain-containing protein n=1 Tax=Solanum tuberosum TaxID=4113 RepID=A0ABQ7WAK4_SOLTU|nr:hypothetical protein KY290_009202 [Solanum tuberosum]
MLGTMYAPPVGGQFQPTGDIPSPNNGQFSYADVISMASKKTRLHVKPPKIYKGKSAAFFTPQEEEESAKYYRFTIVGKFSHGKPAIDDIRRDFAARFPLKGYLMRMVTWTINFNPEKETPLSPIWITLPGLKWHYFNWDALLQITSTIGTLLKIDKATNAKTRPNSAKVMVEIDLVVQRRKSIWVGIKEEDGKEIGGRLHQGHIEDVCLEYGKKDPTKTVGSLTGILPASCKPNIHMCSIIIVENSTGNHANNEDNSEDEEDEYDPDYGVEQESNTEEGSNEDFEECDSSDEDALIDTFAPKTSWKGEKVKDAVSQHRQSLINNGNLSPRSVSRNANVNHKDFAKPSLLQGQWGKHFKLTWYKKLGMKTWMVREWEAKMLDLETDYIENDNDDLRPQIHKTQVEHTRWLKCEQSILRQRANIRWLEYGDSNTKYFHDVINEKRRRATIHRIQSENGQWITRDDQIAKKAVDYFSKLFSDDQEIELHHLDCIDQRVHRDDNNMLEVIPNEVEIKEAVFGLNPDSTPGPDGFGGDFYQSCWDIIKSDLIDVMQQFFGGTGLTKFYTSSCLRARLAMRYGIMIWNYDMVS